MSERGARAGRDEGLAQDADEHVVEDVDHVWQIREMQLGVLLGAPASCSAWADTTDGSSA